MGLRGRNKRTRGAEKIRVRRRAKRAAERAEKAKKAAEEAQNMSETKWDSEWEPETLSTEIISLPESKPERPSKKKNIWRWIKEHVRPDIGITPFKDGESPDWKGDDVYEMADKLKQNLRVGLKITWRF